MFLIQYLHYDELIGEDQFDGVDWWLVSRQDVSQLCARARTGAVLDSELLVVVGKVAGEGVTGEPQLPTDLLVRESGGSQRRDLVLALTECFDHGECDGDDLERMFSVSEHAAGPPSCPDPVAG